RRKKPVERPAIEPLHLADNGIDQVGRGANFVCLKSVIRLGSIVSCSPILEELDLWGNDIGDVGGRLVFEFLQARKEAKLSSMSLRVGPRMNSETFANIQKLGSGIKKRKRGKRGRKKKK
uniref:Ran gtpase-activating protein n=1 Tax=Macrostomum lignano TaxID=282301 RepID=A0A1I8GQJ3_9PLAT